jgi:FMN reductase
MARILAVSGSPSATSRTGAALDAVGHRLVRAGHRVDTLRLRELPAEALLLARFDDPELRRAAALAEEADALVIGTPVYKAAYSGLLKSWLDVLPQYGFARKPVLPVATGGSLAHALIVDYALRPVLTSMGAAVLPGAFVLNGEDACDRLDRVTAGLLAAVAGAPVEAVA